MPAPCCCVPTRPQLLGASLGRPFELLLGAVCAVCGLGLSAFGGFTVWVELHEARATGPAAMLVIAGICAFGAMLLVLGFRLLTNRARRSDGGLMSPLGLRLGGVLFLVAPIAAMMTHPLALLETSSLLAASAACFALARHRERSLAASVPPGPAD